MNYSIILLLFFLLISCKPNNIEVIEKISIENKEIVVLLHGILRSNKNMLQLEKALKEQDYIVLNISYPSTKYSIEDLIVIVKKEIEKNINDNFTSTENIRINYIGYSMGGLIARGVANKHNNKTLGKVIIIGTPNHGSEVSDDWQNNWFYKFLFGKAGQELTTKNIKNLDSALGKVNYTLGVIAGTSNEKYDKWGTDLSVFKGVINDGRVSVNSAKLEGMKDYIELYLNHYRLPSSPNTIEQILYFLANSKFKKEN
jgi:triacylglycerol esterase/lipase EstA (alpha/beta hydrolase family)